MERVEDLIILIQKANLFEGSLGEHGIGIGSVVKKGLEEDPVRPSASELVCSWSRLWQNTDDCIGFLCSELHCVEVYKKGYWMGIKLIPLSLKFSKKILD